MKNKKPLTILLFCAVVIGVLALLQQIALPESYPVEIVYHFPQTKQQVETSSGAWEGETSRTAKTAPIAPEEPTDLEDVQSGTEKAPLSPGEHSDATEAAVEFPLELNGATAEELQLIPRIGEITARRILHYRDQLGGYTDISQLLEVQGIGPVSYETISAYVYVAGDAWDQARTTKETP